MTQQFMDSNNKPIRGLYSIEFDDYLKIPAVSNSELGHVLRSPIYYKHYVLQKNSFKKTEQMDLGSRVHTLILEPASFYDRYEVIPDVDLRSSEGKLAKKKAEETKKEVIRHMEYDKASRIRDAVMGNKQIASLFESIFPERTGIFFQDETPCKIRPDALSFKTNTIIDLKTTRSVHEFQSSLAHFSYHRQAAYYLNGMNAVQDVPFKNFIFVVVQTEEPYFAAAFELSERALAQGQKDYMKGLELIRELKSKNEYLDNLQKSINILDLPEWYYGKTAVVGEFNSKGE